jgi:hypothetical protein
VNPYTAVVMVPDHLAPTFGHDVWVLWVEAADRSAACAEAQKKAALEAQQEFEADSNEEDWFVSALFKGHHPTLLP